MEGGLIPRPQHVPKSADAPISHVKWLVQLALHIGFSYWQIQPTLDGNFHPLWLNLPMYNQGYGELNVHLLKKVHI